MAGPVSHSQKVTVNNEAAAATMASLKYGSMSTNDATSSGVIIENGKPKAPNRNNEGSSVLGAVFNLTKSIVGAGVTGLGGAFASSGGLISVLGILFFGLLSKLSFDLLIELSIGSTLPYQTSSYEALGYAAAGATGRNIVVICKGLYTFGSMVAYMVIVKDNFASAATHWIGRTSAGMNGKHSSIVQGILLDENASTILISTLVILPLCLMRDLKPLEKFSLTGILTILSVIAIVIYLYVTTDSMVHDSGYDSRATAAYVHWFQIRSGLVRSVGTFVFTFIAQHTVHLTFESLRPDIRDLTHWKLVSSISTLISTAIALLAAVFVYMIFWLDTESSMFALYPSSLAIDIAKILLTFMISLTYPLCLLACREILIVALMTTATAITTRTTYKSRHPTIHESSEDDETTTLLRLESVEGTPSMGQRSWLLVGQERQLTRGYHVLITVSLWGVTLFLALVAPSFGDVLNLVGCAMGTAIAFILPAVFSFLLLGYNHKAAFILAVGCPVGILGTYFSFVQLVTDARAKKETS